MSLSSFKQRKAVLLLAGFFLLSLGSCSWSSHQLKGNMLKANDNLLSASKLIDAGHPEEALIVLRSALHQYQLVGNLPLSVQTMNQIGSLYARTQQYSLAVLWFQRSLAIATILSDPSLESDTLALVAQVEWQLGKTAYAQKEVDAGIAISKGIKHGKNRHEVLSVLYSVRGLIHSRLNKRDQALKDFRKSIVYSKKIKDVKKESEDQGNIGRLYLIGNDLPDALVSFQKALVLDQKIQNPEGIAFDSEGLSLVYNNMKSYRQALIRILVAIPIRKLQGPEDLYKKDVLLLHDIENQRHRPQELVILDKWNR
jgi:tetratricopeptide (TPR) repeat protein